MQPADEVSGDYYDIIPHNKELILGIGDVTGHGKAEPILTMQRNIHWNKSPNRKYYLPDANQNSPG